MVGQSVCLCTVSVASKMVVGRPRHAIHASTTTNLATCAAAHTTASLSRHLRIPLRDLSAVPLPGILITNEKEVRRCGGLEVEDVGGI